MKFTPLHINTEYSLQESAIRIDDLIAKAKAEGLTSITMTDHNTMFGVADFMMKCKKNNIKPIVGLDLDVEDFRLVLLAKNWNGYKELVKLSSRKTKGELIKVSEIDFTDLFTIDHPTKGHYAKYGNQLNINDYFIGTTTETLPNAVYMQIGKALDIEQINALKIIYKMADKEFNGNNIEPIKFDVPNSTSVEQAIKIANSINIEIPNNLNPLPNFDTGEISSIAFLKKIIEKNIERIDVNKKSEYIERIKYEVSIIEKLGFEDYFLIIWDLINWARNRKIAIGPGRGSAAGSLVSYMLRITDVDPMKYGLLFERFLNPNRITMPDIDIDIQDTRRDEIINYLFDKYGETNVALISTYSRLGAKSSLRDVARLMQIPVRDVNAISKLIPGDETLSHSYKTIAKFRAIIDSSDEYTQLFNYAKLIEGLPRQISTHAAGIVISNEPINNIAPTVPGLGGLNQIQYSMDHLEDFGLLKIDLLGLRNLTIIQRIQSEIFKNFNKKVDLLKIPTIDKPTNELLTKADTNGIFQLESYGMKKTLRDVGVSSLDDIVAIISLFRPGPMQNIEVYANRKQKKSYEKVSPVFDEITKDTYGIIIYQEQIMHIAQRYSGMSFGQADILRRAISKKNMSLINSLKKEFIEGALRNNHPQEEINKIYELIERFADYGFNKSHAVAYSLISYWMAFLKARFPFEFYTALLDSSMSSQATVKKYVEEAKSKSINIVSPNVNTSEMTVTNSKDTITLPLQIIKGFGDSAAQKLIDERNKNGKFKDFFDFVARARNAGLGESTINLLVEANALQEFDNMQTLIDSMSSAIRYANMVTIIKDGEKIVDASIINKPSLIKQERNISTEIFNEKKAFGFQLNAFKTSSLESDVKLSMLKENSRSSIIFLVEKIFRLKTKDGKEYGKAIISDSSGTFELMIFSEVFKFIENTKDRTIVKGEIDVNVRNNEKQFILRRDWKEINE